MNKKDYHFWNILEVKDMEMMPFKCLKKLLILNRKDKMKNLNR